MKAILIDYSYNAKLDNRATLVPRTQQCALSGTHLVLRRRVLRICPYAWHNTVNRLKKNVIRMPLRWRPSVGFLLCRSGRWARRRACTTWKSTTKRSTLLSGALDRRNSFCLLGKYKNTGTLTNVTSTLFGTGCSSDPSIVPVKLLGTAIF